MLPRLRHGILLGAAWCALAGLLECVVLVHRQPFQREPGIWLEAWALYAGAGGLLGVLSVLCLPLLTRPREWRALPGIYLAGVLGGIACGMLLWARLELTGATRVAACVAAAVAVQQVLRAAASSRWGWLFASLFMPVSALLLLSLTLAAGLVGRAMPPLAGPWTAGTPPPPAAEAPANVLVVCLNGVGAGSLGGFGYYRPTSPRLDALAAEGAIYRAAHAASPAPVAARAALLGVPDGAADGGRDHGDSPGLPLPERLRQAGFLTAGIGPVQGALTPAGGPLGFVAYFAPAATPPAELLFLRRCWRALLPPPVPPLAADQAVATALVWLDRRARTSHPWFLWLELDQALPPYLPPPELRETFLPEGADPARVASGEPRDAAELEVLRALHDAEILDQDRALGRLIDGLRDRDLLEETLLVVVADTGTCFHPHRFDETPRASLGCLTRVPLMIRLPRAVPAGTLSDRLVSADALPPTLLAFLGLATPAEAARALAPIGPDDPTVPREARILDLARGEAVLRTPEALVLRRADGSLRYRDLRADPDEREALRAPADPAEQAAAELLARRLDGASPD